MFLKYIESVQAELGHRAVGRHCINNEDKYCLKEPAASSASYSIDFDAKKVGLSN